MSKESSVCVFLGVLVATGLAVYLLTRKPAAVSSWVPMNRVPMDSEPGPQPAQIPSSVGNPRGGTTYANKEEWAISYNADGLPVKFCITRNASRS